jgi:hypothetical protein
LALVDAAFGVFVRAGAGRLRFAEVERVLDAIAL